MAALTLAPHAKLCCPRLCRLRQAVHPQASIAVRRCAAKQLTTCSATGSAIMANSSASPQYSALVGKQVFLQGQPVAVTDLWTEKDAAVIVLSRELARDLVAQVWPEPLRPLGIKFFLVSIGPPPRAREFCALTGFPEDHLLADPDNVLYDALGMRKDVASTFFNIATPQSIWQRIQKDGAAGLRNALASWKPWVPPKQGQATQQGGVVVFDGQRCVLEHKDRATGAHIDLRALLAAATPLAKQNRAT